MTALLFSCLEYISACVRALAHANNLELHCCAIECNTGKINVQ
jgi:hypothetical protein